MARLTPGSRKDDDRTSCRVFQSKGLGSISKDAVVLYRLSGILNVHVMLSAFSPFIKKGGISVFRMNKESYSIPFVCIVNDLCLLSMVLLHDAVNIVTNKIPNRYFVFMVLRFMIDIRGFQSNCTSQSLSR